MNTWLLASVAHISSVASSMLLYCLCSAFICAILPSKSLRNVRFPLKRIRIGHHFDSRVSSIAILYLFHTKSAISDVQRKDNLSAMPNLLSSLFYVYPLTSHSPFFHMELSRFFGISCLIFRLMRSIFRYLKESNVFFLENSFIH